MSSPSPAASDTPGAARLIALCGAGSSSGHLTRATVAAAREEGLRTTVVALGEIDPVVAAGDTPWLALCGLAARSAGRARLPLAATTGLADARTAAALAAVDEALAAPGTDLVVVDAGDVHAARSLLGHPDAVLAALDAVLGPDLAMRSCDGPDADFARLADARVVAARQARLLTGPQAAWRLVVASDAGTVPVALDSLAALVVLGARVDGIVLDDFPRKHAPAERRRSAAAARAALEDAVDVAVWRGGPGRRARPAGGSVAAPPGPVAALEPSEPRGDDDTWEWTIGLPDSVASTARVGVDADRLVVAAGGAYRWLGLPAVLRRTIAAETVRVRGGLQVLFRPDPAAWPSPRSQGRSV